MITQNQESIVIIPPYKSGIKQEKKGKSRQSLV